MTFDVDFDLTLHALKIRDEQFAALKRLWQTLLPDVPLADEEIYMWIDNYRANVVAHSMRVAAFARAKKRQRGIEMDPLYVRKYTASCARNAANSASARSLRAATETTTIA